MYEVSHRQNIMKFQSIDLSGDAKQTSHVRNTSAPLFLSFSPVSELLFELLYCKRTEMLYELFQYVPENCKFGIGSRDSETDSGFQKQQRISLDFQKRIKDIQKQFSNF